jgi:hypothetical protein
MGTLLETTNRLAQILMNVWTTMPARLMLPVKITRVALLVPVTPDILRLVMMNFVMM